ncbi:hypothetical protein IEQ34_009079 [Dendrobium chrysotoxum]|uniref:Uncharacterized protein n=1 Tax=Dendrobium chrysotoxum TaxID=161865 RepID=A0AAV7GIA0_DENCH|nr:hypothetical protein IEQ34_009079 [Dendrobium chrysotoxum]
METRRKRFGAGRAMVRSKSDFWKQRGSNGFHFPVPTLLVEKSNIELKKKPKTGSRGVGEGGRTRVAHWREVAPAGEAAGRSAEGRQGGVVWGFAASCGLGRLRDARENEWGI